MLWDEEAASLLEEDDSPLEPDVLSEVPDVLWELEEELEADSDAPSTVMLRVLLVTEQSL